MASAILTLYPKAKLGIGPPISGGFYYDFDLPEKIAESDLPKIEKIMKDLIKKKLSFERKELSIAEAKNWARKNNQPYKLELIKGLEREGVKKVSFYKTGDFCDLCAGPHVSNTSKIEHFKLLSIAGAYWRGIETNPMLTRIYGTAWNTKDELDEYLKQIEEAKKRDHRKLGRELDLFSFHKEAPGFVFWHPKGMLLREALMNVYDELQKKAGYQFVSTPILLSEDLWRKSGHWNHYKDKMYFTKVDNQTFAIKPMNCPGMSLIYKDRIHSYKELPLKLAEAGEVHRHELSGTLHGLFRVRAFRQDDAHIFAREDQIEEEIRDVINLTLRFYEIIGFKDVDIELSTRPEKSMGSDEIWERAENTLRKVLDDMDLKFKINKGEGSFYGPKIDFHIKDSLGRLWQCGTIQLDFFMPERFGLEYIDKDGSAKRPVMIHRTVIGSIQRFVGILIEHYGGAFPVWLSPVQAIIIPIAERHTKYAESLKEKLIDSGIRTECDVRSETMQSKIRDAQLQKIPYMLIIGDKEEKTNTLAIRTRERKEAKGWTIDRFISKIKENIVKKGLNLII